MITRELAYPVRDARLLVKGALELIDDVETYYENERGVVTAKTGFRFGLLASSYGETLTIDLRAIDGDSTEITVIGEKIVDINVGANPDRYTLAFVRKLETLAEYPLDDVIELLEEETREQTKEVTAASDQSDGTPALAAVVFGICLLFLALVFL